MKQNFQNQENHIKEAIYEFLVEEGETRSKAEIFSLLEGPTTRRHPNLGQLFIFESPLGEFWVCGATGKLFSFSAPERFSAAEAQDYVLNFLRRHIEDFENRRFKQIKAEMDDPFWEEEWLEEPRFDDEISIFKNWVVISVNLDTRRVHYFNSSNLRLVRKEKVALNELEASKMILDRFPEGKIEDLELMEHTTNGGQTVITIWSATVNPDGDPESPLQIVSLNADTGEVVSED
jgi:hypothetical protein